MPATVIAERIGWAYGMTILKERVRELRPLFQPPDPCQRTFYRPGELASGICGSPTSRSRSAMVRRRSSGRSWCDGVLPVDRRLDGAVTDRRDVLGGMGQASPSSGRCPARGCGTRRRASAAGRRGHQRLTDEFQRFRGGYGVAVKFCRPADPEAKGLVERANRYLETSFLPGRRFDDVADFNGQLATWLRQLANQRILRPTKVRPAEAIFEDRASMQAFPPVLPDPACRFSAGRPRPPRKGRDL